MATLTDIALNDPPAVEALARNPLSLVGTAAEKAGTAAATPEDTIGALVMARLDPTYAYRQNAKQRRIKAVEDIYATQESRLREQRVGLTKGERLLETLAAFGQPVSGGMGEALDRDEFWKVFNGCCQKMPERIACAFVLREVDDLSSDEICHQLNITPNNLWVMLHRARMALRHCLEVNWFGAKN